MKNRFEGDKGLPVLIDALKGQSILDGNKAAVEFIASKAQLIEVQKGQSIITQDGEDNDFYFIVAGSFDIIVNGRSVAVRAAQ